MLVIINGSTGEIGNALVSVFSESDLSIIGLGRNEEKLLKLESEHPNFVGFRISSVTSQNEIDNLKLFLDKKFRGDWPISGYIHAVADFKRFGDPLEIPIDEWRNSIDINLTGTYIWNQAILRIMKNNSSGSLVNIVSQAWKTGGFSPIGPYAASKGGIVTMSSNFARLLGKYGVRVNCVSPGYVDSSMMNSGLDKATQEKLAMQVPLERFAKPKEIANACKFLISPESSYINGTVIDVSGGLTYP